MEVLKEIKTKMFISRKKMESFMEENEVDYSFLSAYDDFFNEHYNEKPEGIVMEEKDIYELAMLVIGESEIELELNAKNVSAVIYALAQLAETYVQVEFYKEGDEKEDQRTLWDFYAGEELDEVKVLSGDQKKIHTMDYGRTDESNFPECMDDYRIKKYCWSADEGKIGATVVLEDDAYGNAGSPSSDGGSGLWKHMRK